jgi:hypothetical protein
MSGFSKCDFARRLAILDDVLTMPKSGRKLAIGPMDSLLLIMHWLRKDALINAIAAAFHLRSFTLSNTLKQIAVDIRPRLVEEFITKPGTHRFAAVEKICIIN